MGSVQQAISENLDSDVRDVMSSIENELLQLYGYVIGGRDLRVLLGYPSVEALRQAIWRGTTPVPVFVIEHRRGQFALAKDIAVWLATSREHAKSSASLKMSLAAEGASSAQRKIS